MLLAADIVVAFPMVLFWSGVFLVCLPCVTFILYLAGDFLKLFGAGVTLLLLVLSIVGYLISVPLGLVLLLLSRLW